MQKSADTRLTAAACCLANIVMAVAVNFTPVLFIPLRDRYGFSFSQLGALVLVNFITQVSVDLGFAKLVDRHGYRPFIVAGQALTALGFLLFAATPRLFPGAEYAGIAAATVVFSAGAGLMELLLSPITDALPHKNREKAMSLLHSFYAWGQILTVAVTTLLLLRLRGDAWPWVLLGWTSLPLVTTALFLRVPLPKRVEAHEAMPIRRLAATPLFVLAFFAMIFGGASELAMSQWTSSFLERAMALPKVWGDILGMSGFALMMGLGRLLHGLFGERVPVGPLLSGGALAAAGLYVTAALSGSGALAVAACGLTGLCVSLLWPGTLMVCARALPLAGASMFALLSAGGDLGCAVGPSLAGVVGDAAARLAPAGVSPEEWGLRAGILAGTLFPLGAFFCQLALRRLAPRPKKPQDAA